MTIRKFLGLFQIGFLDLSMGAFIAHLLHLAFFGDHAPPIIYAAGAAIGVLPDVDLLLALAKRGPLDLSHRNTLFHQPLFLAFLPTLVLAFLSPFWAWLWVLPLMWHYLHDTVGESMGIQWIFPLSRDKYAVYDLSPNGQRKFFTTYPENHPGMNLEAALQKKFYPLTPTSVIEVLLPIALLLTIILTW